MKYLFYPAKILEDNICTPPLLHWGYAFSSVKRISATSGEETAVFV